jgi:hypothetical protein
MLKKERKDFFFRDMPTFASRQAHMATLHYGSKKNIEFEGETYGCELDGSMIFITGEFFGMKAAPPHSHFEKNHIRFRFHL